MDIFEQGRERAKELAAQAAEAADRAHMRENLLRSAQMLADDKIRHVNDQVRELYRQMIDNEIKPTCTIWKLVNETIETGRIFKSRHIEESRRIIADGWIIWHDGRDSIDSEIELKDSLVPVRIFESRGLVLRADGTVSAFRYVRRSRDTSAPPEKLNEYGEPISVPYGDWTNGKLTEMRYDLTSVNSAFELTDPFHPYHYSETPMLGNNYISYERPFEDALSAYLAAKPAYEEREANQIYIRARNAYCFAAGVEDGLISFVARIFYLRG